MRNETEKTIKLQKGTKAKAEKTEIRTKTGPAINSIKQRLIKLQTDEVTKTREEEVKKMELQIETAIIMLPEKMKHVKRQQERMRVVKQLTIIALEIEKDMKLEKVEMVNVVAT